MSNRNLPTLSGGPNDGALVDLFPFTPLLASKSRLHRTNGGAGQLIWTSHFRLAFVYLLIWSVASDKLVNHLPVSIGGLLCRQQINISSHRQQQQQQQQQEQQLMPRCLANVMIGQVAAEATPVSEDETSLFSPLINLIKGSSSGSGGGGVIISSESNSTINETSSSNNLPTISSEFGSAKGAFDQHQNKVQQTPSISISVSCNSRCHCLIVESSVSVNQTSGSTLNSTSASSPLASQLAQFLDTFDPEPEDASTEQTSSTSGAAKDAPPDPATDLGSWTFSAQPDLGSMASPSFRSARLANRSTIGHTHQSQAQQQQQLHPLMAGEHQTEHQMMGRRPGRMPHHRFVEEQLSLDSVSPSSGFPAIHVQTTTTTISRLTGISALNFSAKFLPFTSAPPPSRHQTTTTEVSQSTNESTTQVTQTTSAPTTSQHWLLDERLIATIEELLDGLGEPAPLAKANNNTNGSRKDEIAGPNYDGLSLANNVLPFELWTELYALLAVRLRAQPPIYLVDLSRNSLAKLGVTFTGYLEHHLVAHRLRWPFVAGSVEQHGTSGDQFSAPLSLPAIQSQARTLRHSLTSAGRLYGRIMDRKWASKLANNNDTLQHQWLRLLQQPMQVRALDLSHNKLKWLINDQFRSLKLLQSIRLDHNKLRYIHQHAFAGLDQLRHLNLASNRLQVIYVDQFQSNYNLQSLVLSSNYLAYLRGGSFASLQALRRLDLSKNKLAILSKNAFVGLDSLELLNCSSNQFVHAPSTSLHPLTSLRRLDLSSNLIAQLTPGAFFHLPLEELDMSSNEQLVAIERGAFWDLPYLRRLSLARSPILMQINMQAFVATPLLQTIIADECPSLDQPARELFENITQTAIARQLLRNELDTTSQSTLLRSTAPLPVQQTLINSTSASILNGTVTSSPLLLLLLNSKSTNKSSIQGAALDNQQEAPSDRKRLLVAYYAGSLALLIVALKLVFKFTSTGRYIESRRNQRRVYEMTATGQPFLQPLPVHQVCLESAPPTPTISMSGSSSGSSSSGADSEGASRLPSSSASSCLSEPLDSASIVDQPFEESPGDLSKMRQAASGCSRPPSVTVEETTASSSLSALVNPQVGQQEDYGHLFGGHIMPDVAPNQPSIDLVMQPGQLECCAAGQLASVSSHQLPGESDNCAISVISGELNSAGTPDLTCPDCCQEAAAAAVAAAAANGSCCSVNPSQPEGLSNQIQQQMDTSGEHHHQQVDRPSMGGSEEQTDIFQSHLLAAGFTECGHANCAHFYQSLGPALQLADMTSNFVNSMDSYY